VKLRRKLLKWYDANRRDLPWRGVGDPYATWVSEIMLQQTRVETVIPYFHRFMERFPNPQALAEATEDEVMSVWSGLGYYRRARLLHRGARAVVERFRGQVPEAAADRRSLPGVGRYTAGAIGSIAFGLREPLVDGNVGRVFARLFAIETPLGDRSTERHLWALAEEWVDGPRPGDLNQALMELGAMICTPRNPRCPDCPLRLECAARLGGRQAELPARRQKRRPKEVRMVAVVATLGDALWLRKSEGELFMGLWNPPWVPLGPEADEEQSARDLLDACGLKGRVRSQPLGEIEHLLTHRRLRASVWRAVAVKGLENERLRIFPRGALADLGVSTFGRKLISTGAER